MNYEEEQKNELEALSEIYYDEIKGKKLITKSITAVCIYIQF